MTIEVDASLPVLPVVPGLSPTWINGTGQLTKSVKMPSHHSGGSRKKGKRRLISDRSI
jgi:hypothetical protein